MYKCDACHKHYSSEYNLKKHIKRQPLCQQWIDLNPGIKDYVDDKFMIPLTDIEKSEIHHKCFVCGTDFANLGNLNRHLDHNIICCKWSMYKDLEPLMTYIRPKDNCYASISEDDSIQTKYDSFNAPTYNLCHIIWNIFLIDKDFALLPNFEDILKENNIEFILAILPDEKVYTDNIKIKIDHHIMKYENHNTFIDINEFDSQIIKIEEYRKQRKNIFVFCNNGYQRSIPFLCYYLTKYHSNEVPNIENAIDLILPQIDKNNYASTRNDYIESMKTLIEL